MAQAVESTPPLMAMPIRALLTEFLANPGRVIYIKRIRMAAYRPEKSTN
jgi:hypothetical protein